MIEYDKDFREDIPKESLFVDDVFLDTQISADVEKMFIDLQLAELSEAKSIFLKMSNEYRIKCIRYIFSYRILESKFMDEDKIKKYLNQSKETYGTICDLEHNYTTCITVETPVITRVLYICEAIAMEDFQVIENSLKPLGKGYDIVLQTIKTRLKFHYGV
jgi:hypothetical protein